MLHLLYANTINRGGRMHLAGGTTAGAHASIEVIEELLPLADTKVTLRGLPKIARVTLEPQGEELAFRQDGDQLEISVAKFTCHQMIALHEA